MPEKQKILILTSSFPANEESTVGGGGFILRLAQELSLAYQPIVIAPKFNGSRTHEVINGVQVKRFGFLPLKRWYSYFNQGIFNGFRSNKWLIPFFLFFLVKQLIVSSRAIKAHGITLIHAHWILPQGLTAILLKRLFPQRHLRIIITSHGSDLFALQRISLIKKWILNRSNLVTVVSNHGKQYMATNLHITSPVVIASMGIDTSLFHPEKKDIVLKNQHQIKGNFLLFVGRLSEEKGVKYLINAMPGIVEQFPDSKLVIIGDGNQKETLRMQAQNLQMENYIVFLGALPSHELPAYYATADIFIGPSVREGFGLVFAEAASSGCIVVSSNFPAIKDIVIDDKTGFIVPQKDPQAIADKVSYLLNNKGLWPAIKANARKQVVQKFDWESVGQKYLSLIQTIQDDK